MMYKYNKSPTKALLSVYSEYNWIVWKFKSVPDGFWCETTNHKKFFDWLGGQLGVKSFEDWYDITHSYIVKHGGLGLLQRYYNNSTMNALLSIYQEFHWVPWKFAHLKVQPGIWDSGIYDLEFVSAISKHLRISKLDDWYRVSKDDLEKNSALTFFKRRGGVLNILSKLYAHHSWDKSKFSSKQKRSSQWWLYKTIKEILPSHIEVIEEYVHPVLRLKTGCQIIFDAFVPSFNLVFEYNGLQHYNDNFMFGEVKSFRQRDIERNLLCSVADITYVEVPYWWQRDKESIAAVLHKYRPDIAPSVPEVIPFAYDAQPP